MMTYDKFPKEKCSKFYQISAEFSQISRLSGSTFHGCGFGRALNTRPAHPREKREKERARSMWLQVFMNCLLPLKSVLCAVRSHNCRWRWRWAMRKLSKVLRDHRAQKLRHDRIKFKVLYWQETVLCLFTVVNALFNCENGATRNEKENEIQIEIFKSRQDETRWEREPGESNRYGHNAS